MSLRPIVLATLLGSALLAAGPALAESFVTFQIPGGTDIDVVKINNMGTVAGSYTALGKQRGFVRNAAGQVTTFDYNGKDTAPTSISDDGTVVGYYFDGSLLGGFKRSPNGTMTQVTIPGGGFTAVHGISNTSGMTAGFYRKVNEAANIAFVANASGDAVAILPPASSEWRDSVANAVNDGGTAVGYFAFGIKETGFVRTPDGTVTVFDAVSGSTDPRVTRQTEPVAVNNGGTVAGEANALVCPWDCHTRSVKGFIRSPGGQVTLFSAFGARGMSVAALNNLGQVTGYYSLPRQPQLGYVRNADGTTVSFQVPNMPIVRPTSINDQGVVAGVSHDSASNDFGFIRMP